MIYVFMIKIHELLKCLLKCSDLNIDEYLQDHEKFIVLFIVCEFIDFIGTFSINSFRAI